MGKAVSRRERGKDLAGCQQSTRIDYRVKDSPVQKGFQLGRVLEKRAGTAAMSLLRDADNERAQSERVVISPERVGRESQRRAQKKAKAKKIWAVQNCGAAGCAKTLRWYQN